MTQLPRVDIIFASADMSPDLIDAPSANGAKGIVIAGVGNGNMNKASVDAAANAVKKGVVVVRSSRVRDGTRWAGMSSSTTTSWASSRRTS